MLFLSYTQRNWVCLYKALHLTRGRILPFESENRGKGFSALIRASRRSKKHVPDLTEEMSEGFTKMEFIPTNEYY